ncbi:LemA family protein [Nitratireductor aquimarinus]|uniref:LemA family protein n=1 Tax=Nitratireductor aquimarinus TaxID=889300 RepID=UPI003B5B1239
MTTILIIVLVLFGGFVFFQNRLASTRNSVLNGFSGVQVQLKRRHDLVPALVSAARSAIAQENRLFDSILDVREKAVAALNGRMEEVQEAEAELTASLRSFFGYTEDHPEITSTGNILELQKQLEETEDQISAARRLYNGNVERYNTMLDAIPSSWVATMLRFERADFFALSDAERKNVEAVPAIDLPGAQA